MPDTARLRAPESAGVVVACSEDELSRGREADAHHRLACAGEREAVGASAAVPQPHCLVPTASGHRSSCAVVCTGVDLTPVRTDRLPGCGRDALSEGRVLAGGSAGGRVGRGVAARLLEELGVALHLEHVVIELVGHVDLVGVRVGLLHPAVEQLVVVDAQLRVLLLHLDVLHLQRLQFLLEHPLGHLQVLQRILVLRTVVLRAVEV
mmetsp:Transcript_2747/g.9708  ORF Transcript_2747/g.9708 Transcript_2747/m.9708 type:complete len:207 (-) Transcript_2747:453-1073(-)